VKAGLVEMVIDAVDDIQGLGSGNDTFHRACHKDSLPTPERSK